MMKKVVTLLTASLSLATWSTILVVVDADTTGTLHLPSKNNVGPIATVFTSISSKKAATRTSTTTTTTAATTPTALIKSAGIIKIEDKSNMVHFAAVISFTAGFVNGCFLSGLLAPTKQGVAAVTGAWTNSAIGLANGNMRQFLGQAAIILSFLSGSMIYGLICPRPTAFELPKKQVSAGMFLASACLLGADIILRVCAKTLTWGEQWCAFCLAAVASGIMNSLTSSHSGNLCRTTHFSGISSDMGTFLGQVLKGNKENLFKLVSFAKIASGFWLGGFCAIEACGWTHSVSKPMVLAAAAQALMGMGILLKK